METNVRAYDSAILSTAPSPAPAKDRSGPPTVAGHSRGAHTPATRGHRASLVSHKRAQERGGRQGGKPQEGTGAQGRRAGGRQGERQQAQKGSERGEAKPQEGTRSAKKAEVEAGGSRKEAGEEEGGQGRGTGKERKRAATAVTGSRKKAQAAQGAAGSRERPLWGGLTGVFAPREGRKLTSASGHTKSCSSCESGSSCPRTPRVMSSCTSLSLAPGAARETRRARPASALVTRPPARRAARRPCAVVSARRPRPRAEVCCRSAPKARPTIQVRWRSLTQS